MYAYKNRSNYDFLNFIFSAVNFNDALRRIQYLKSYRAYREERAENIRRTQDMLQTKIEGLKVTRLAKDEALKKQSKERSILEDEKKEKDAVVYHLQSQEKELRKEMATKQKQDARLGAAITVAIKRARDLAIKEEAKKRADAKAAEKTTSSTAKTNRPENNEPATPATLNVVKDYNKTVFTSEEDLHLSGDFIKHKGQLPWPLSGTVSMAFGLHEYIKGIKHFNQGVTIDVAAGTTVKSVYEGEVSSIFNVGDVQGVVVRHGKYFTGYSNLSNVAVSKGQHVRTGEALGRVGEVGQLEFMLMDEKGKYFDPEIWLRH